MRDISFYRCPSNVKQFRSYDTVHWNTYYYLIDILMILTAIMLYCAPLNIQITLRNVYWNFLISSNVNSKATF